MRVPLFAVMPFGEQIPDLSRRRDIILKEKKPGVTW
jgi:hypothetical protein